MAEITLDITPSPELVRVARLLAVSVARKRGMDDDLVEDVRLAVGEATARAVVRQQAQHVDAPVRVVISDGPEILEVRLAEGSDPSLPDSDGGVALDMVKALAHEYEELDRGSTVTMGWHPVAESDPTDG